MRRTRIAVLAAAALAVAVVAAVARPDAAASAEEPVAGITVTGTASVSVVPDRATFWFGVQSEGRTASAALNANTTAINRVVAALRSAGIAAADLQTQQVSLSPRQDEDGEITGYVAANSVSAQIRDLDRTGAVVDAAVNAGANQVSGPQLTRADQATPYRNALRAAVADARAKAQQLAAASNVTLGPIVAVVEAGGAAPVPLDQRSGAESASVVPGTQEVQASVTVTFGLTG